MISKQELRQEALSRRESLSQEELETKSEQIKDSLFQLDEFNQARVICCYVAVRSEVRTASIIKESLSRLNKAIVVPITQYPSPTPLFQQPDRLLLSELRDIDQELHLVRFGLLEPKPQYQRIVPFQRVDLTIVPGLAFDKRGYRIGYGGGYYDWLLNQLRDKPSIGLAFEIQIVPQIPIMDWDRPVNRLITEERSLVCSSCG